jgi:hypothetical protein
MRDLEGCAPERLETAGVTLYTIPFKDRFEAAPSSRDSYLTTKDPFEAL